MLNRLALALVQKLTGPEVRVVRRAFPNVRIHAKRRVARKIRLLEYTMRNELARMRNVTPCSAEPVRVTMHG